MKRMSIYQYAEERLAAKTRWQRLSLFFRSLTLRYWLWKSVRRQP